jgi:Fe2+ or Zn2+ uptake regulation protein
LPTGFTLEGYEVVLQGICEGCQDSGDDATA